MLTFEKNRFFYIVNETISSLKEKVKTIYLYVQLISTGENPDQELGDLYGHINQIIQKFFKESTKILNKT